MSEERRAHEKGRRHEKEESNFKINKIKQTTLNACIEEKQLTCHVRNNNEPTF